jgi:hypothetical protein
MVHVLLKVLAWQFRRELSEPLKIAKGANNLIGTFFPGEVLVCPAYLLIPQHNFIPDYPLSSLCKIGFMSI